ncbi:MAG TPA: quinone-dependent dihydroorotate dehydrogenase [Longimicrobiaceae bacterium]|nr:quinone-dependent dihydroorotate dehydrogenase [Longimicrobiaceae bacterium]
MTPYRLLRPFLYTLPAEAAHEWTTLSLTTALAPAAVRSAVRRRLEVRDEALHVTRFGIEFPNPVGLAAGFDKSGTAFNALAALGFGAIEIGTVTAHAQPGNPLPRLFRLPADEALLNRMGFNNPGAAAVAERLASTRIEPVLGINLGKSKVTPNEAAAEDYLASLDKLERFARYLVVNVSSPNTPGLRALQDAGPLRALLRALAARARELAAARGEAPRPILLKIAPDLTDSQIDEAVGIAAEEGAAGIIATNTTISRAGLRTPATTVERLGAGGISGQPLRERALDVVRRIHRRTGAALPIIGVGGIGSAQDAWERIAAGASLIQLYTAFIYRGPTLVRDINLGLLERLHRAGMKSLDEAVGSESATR